MTDSLFGHKGNLRVRSYLARFRRYFLTGLLVVTPLGLTIWIIAWLINLVDGKTRHFLKSLLDRLNLDYHFTAFGHDYSVIPFGFGLFVVFFGICFVGMIASNYFGRQFFNLVDLGIRRVPGVSWIYNAVTQVSHAFLNRKKNIFLSVVLLEFPRDGIFMLGFITSERIPWLTSQISEDVCSVFIPTTPNITTGFLALVSKGKCRPLGISVEDAMKMIISAGVMIPTSDSLIPVNLKDLENSQSSPNHRFVE